ncbi:MAG: L-threonylcarbamoyladenylate synthase [Thermoanaerobaculaceae bacterium]|jgi:L-threonylcarbamoyladenylate synthase|nr:L-threonylcarbamoyladenylate synthase [Thermoanaerobaculaceae bacterium]
MRRLRFREIGDLAGAVEACREAMARHGVIAFPTETFYGLAVPPDDPAGVDALLALKGRPADKALPLVAADLRQVEGLVRVPPGWRERLAGTWPAALSVVLVACRPLAACGSTAAVRIPVHPLLRALLLELGPLTATSANRAASPALSDPELVARDLGHGLDLLLDGGSSPGGLPSTLLDLTADPPKVLRPGAFAMPPEWAVNGA